MTRVEEREKNIRIINARFKAKLNNFRDAWFEARGRYPTTHDPEYWELADWYRKEMEKWRSDHDQHSTTRGEIVEVEQEDGEVIQYVTAEDRKCEMCWEPLKKKAGRGRWPKRCETCKKGKKDENGEGESDE